MRERHAVPGDDGEGGGTAEDDRDEVRRQRSAWYSLEKVLVPAQVPPD